MKELVSIHTAFGGDRRAERDQSHNAPVWAGSAQARGCAEGKSAEDDGQMKLGIQPVERRADVFHLPIAAIVLAFAQSRAAKIEAQHREPETIERFHRAIHHFVVHRAAI